MARDALREELRRFGLTVDPRRVKLFSECLGRCGCDSCSQACDEALPKGWCSRRCAAQRNLRLDSTGQTGDKRLCDTLEDEA
jgi:hypothetical protein